MRPKVSRMLARILAIVLVSVVLTSGCASIINPFVKLGNHPTGNITLNQAIDYANTAKEKYRGALGDRARFKSLLGAGLSPLEH